ncbi:MAG TPA: hypothetical protein VMY76_06705 [Gemmatimonadales bacterium]|nr:hypothetical protein [Gemmatimonadales bacterium]
MAKPDCWSRTLGTKRGFRVRVYEREPGGVLQVSVWLPESGESRRSLGHRDRDRAIRAARELVNFRHEQDKPGKEQTPSLALGVLFARYVAEGKYLADGSLKTEPYLRHIAAAGRNLGRHFGEEFRIAELTPARLSDYVRLRREGRITGNVVRTNAIQRELTILKSALNWARGVYDADGPLLQHHALEAFRIPGERDPKRPVVSEATVAALRPCQ